MPHLTGRFFLSFFCSTVSFTFLQLTTVEQWQQFTGEPVSIKREISGQKLSSICVFTEFFFFIPLFFSLSFFSSLFALLSQRPGKGHKVHWAWEAAVSCDPWVISGGRKKKRKEETLHRTTHTTAKRCVLCVDCPCVFDVCTPLLVLLLSSSQERE